jgi:tetratricopeptide (TPR) repeat protein
MRKKISRTVAGLLLWCSFVCLSSGPWCYAQKTGSAGSDAVRISVADGLSVVNRIKAVESPAFRAYLYSRVAAWLSRSADKDQALARLAVETAAAGISDIHEHEAEIPPTPANGFYTSLLEIVRRYNPAEAGRLRSAYPLKRNAELSERNRAGAALHTALAKLGDPQTAKQSIDEATRLVLAGSVPVSTLHGEILNLVETRSPALPQLLSAALAWEERVPGSLPLQNIFFLSPFCLADSMPMELRTRFLSVAVSAVRLNTGATGGDPQDRVWAIQLLRQILPHMQKLTPGLYAVGSAQLAALAPDVPQGDDVFARVRNSSDPLSQAITEANFAADEQVKGQLFEMAARLAKEQGKLRQAVELLTSVEEDRRGMREGYSHRDELLDDLLQQALKREAVETARLAASKMSQPADRAAGLRLIARHFVKAGDTPAALEALNDAAKRLEEAKDGKQKAVSYFELAVDFADLDDARAFAVLRDGVKTVNNLPGPTGGEKAGDFTWSLFPVADGASKAFRVVARKDRGGALGLAEMFQPKEFKIAAAVGVYSSTAQESALAQE